MNVSTSTQAGGPRKRPRTCVGCLVESPKRSMVRVVRVPDGTIRIDLGGRCPGRGAYVCRSRECVSRAKKRDALSRALKTKVPVEIYDMLLEMCPPENEEDATP